MKEYQDWEQEVMDFGAPLTSVTPLTRASRQYRCVESRGPARLRDPHTSGLFSASKAVRRSGKHCSGQYLLLLLLLTESL